MAVGLRPVTSDYNPAVNPYATSEYDPTQAPPMRRLVSGGRTTTPGIVEYRPPAYDESKIKAYQQEAMAPGLSRLRRQAREAQASRYSSPTERREAMRGLMRGYGEALAPLQAGAGTQARQRYDIQYQQAIMAEKQRVAAEERAAEREYQESLRDEAEAKQAEVDMVIIGYNAAGRPIYGTPQEAATIGMQQEGEWVGHSTTGYRRGVDSPQITGLTEASLRPISSEPVYGRSLEPEPAGPEPAYPSNWMY
ncbi:hypothetical protein KAR91_64520 [Candidatus Pacearchaeota archaeon]|nr:hypothetical protein [Candidatus Pacearchaeota archaeon]